jgi:hypothetical protein
MLLMDTSGSMAWTHMPDEVEKVGTVDYTGSIGYRSTQCNSIYYNPAVDYILPKYPDGTFFPQPSFGAAPYAGSLRTTRRRTRPISRSSILRRRSRLSMRRRCVRRVPFRRSGHSRRTTTSIPARRR